MTLRFKAIARLDYVNPMQETFLKVILSKNVDYLLKIQAMGNICMMELLYILYTLGAYQY